MATEKIVQYTTDQTKTAVSSYQLGVSVEDIATQLGKSVRSVIAKLSREGVYKSKARSASTRVTKEMLISAIAVKFRVTSDQLESLGKADKATLEILAG